MTVNPASGTGGSTATVTGSTFAAEPVEIHWDSIGGPLIGSASGPNFSTSVTIPNVSSGDYHIIAFSRDPGGVPRAGPTAAFKVTPPPAKPADPSPQGFVSTWQPAPSLFLPPSPDLVGPAIAAGALTRGNGSRTVSANGAVWVFCGRFAEPVSGTCAASSTRRLVRLRSGRGPATRTAALTLTAKRFQTVAGRRVLVRFVLSKASMQLLSSAGRLSMRGSVQVRDSSGNVTRASFPFMLKAPASRGQ